MILISQGICRRVPEKRPLSFEASIAQAYDQKSLHQIEKGASIECCRGATFSSASVVLGKQRIRLSDETFEKLLLLQQY
jgi:hypothetical protein